MAERVRITGGDIDGSDNEGHDAQVDKKGNLRVREGIYDFDNITYEDTSFVTGDSPATHDFNADAGRNAVDGYIICDGAGNIQVDVSRNGIAFGSKFTMKKGERVNLAHFNIDKIRVTWVSDSAYRINLI
ncbi:MAG: hypothetical protein CMI54_06105 [Parcubacteria group bacterium]|jgi:hypothetical protein|nr:hypothetical protein [Parcubacteria group bacterium]|tara:strand:+ start:568 stop:957 length:390 start_codon:yes stop_codon:yes gene_type:complete